MGKVYVDNAGEKEMMSKLVNVKISAKLYADMQHVVYLNRHGTTARYLRYLIEKDVKDNANKIDKLDEYLSRAHSKPGTMREVLRPSEPVRGSSPLDDIVG